MTRWADPPPPVKSRWPGRLEPLMAEPGRWAIVFMSDSTNGAQCCARDLRNARFRRPAGRWEFAARGREVYARYLGGDG